jgi:ribonuclease P protein component
VDGEFSKAAGKRGGTGLPSSPARARYAFPGRFRLQRTADFERVYRRGRKRSSAHVACHCFANGLGHSRFGITIKAAVGTAVRRNRIKRRVREVIRLHREEFPAGWDVILHPKPEVGTLPFAQLEQEFVALLQRALAQP